MAREKGSRRLICVNPECEKYGKQVWRKPGTDDTCEACRGKLERDNKNMTEQPPAPALAETEPGTQQEGVAPGVPEEIDEFQTPGEESSELPEPEEKPPVLAKPFPPSAPAVKPAPPPKPQPAAQQFREGDLVKCLNEKCAVQFFVNKGTNGRCHSCGQNRLELVKPAN